MSDADDAEALRELQAEYPQLVITTELYWGVRLWVARGGDGHPWLVLSSNLDRFPGRARSVVTRVRPPAPKVSGACSMVRGGPLVW